jgi:hypothetical protein
MTDDKTNPADIAFKAMQDARNDGSVQTDNAAGVVQRLELVASKLRKEHSI